MPVVVWREGLRDGLRAHNDIERGGFLKKVGKEIRKVRRRDGSVLRATPAPASPRDVSGEFVLFDVLADGNVVCAGLVRDEGRRGMSLVW